MDARISRLLNDILRRGEYSAKELARAAQDCHPSHINRVARGEAMLSAKKLIALSHWLQEAGDTRLAEVWCTDRYMVVARPEGTATGNVDRLIGKVTEAIGKYREAMREGDIEGAEEAMHDMREVYQDGRAEVDRMAASERIRH